MTHIGKMARHLMQEAFVCASKWWSPPRIWLQTTTQICHPITIPPLLWASMSIHKYTWALINKYFKHIERKKQKQGWSSLRQICKPVLTHQGTCMNLHKSAACPHLNTSFSPSWSPSFSISSFMSLFYISSMSLPWVFYFLCHAFPPILLFVPHT